MVILNKVDLTNAEELQKVRDWINNRMNRVRIVEAVECDVPLEILLAVGRFDPMQLAEDDNGKAHHDHTFSTWSFEAERPLSLDALTEMVKKKLPGNVYRCKGVVYTIEHPDRRVILQAVGRRSDISLEDEWGARTARTQIVAIGASNSIDTNELTAMFEACAADSVVAMIEG
jgi:G3E family GTPase